MKQTTLQLRIEERAKLRLLKVLRDAALKEREIEGIIGDKELFTAKLDVRDNYTRNNKTEIEMYNDFSEKVFKRLLPIYITNVTDEIMKKIDEIDYLLDSKQYD